MSNKIRQEVVAGLSTAIKSHESAAEGVHKVLIIAIGPAYKTNQVHELEYILNTLTGVKGSFRVQTVVHYLQQVGGFEITEKGDKYTVKLQKMGEISAVFPELTFDRSAEQYSKCKETKYRFWKIAVKEAKALSLPDLAKIPSSIEVQIARGLALDAFTVEEAQGVAAKIVENAIKLATGKKTKEWVNQFYSQNPEYLEEALRVEEGRMVEEEGEAQ